MYCMTDCASPAKNTNVYDTARVMSSACEDGCVCGSVCTGRYRHGVIPAGVLVCEHFNDELSCMKPLFGFM